MATKTAKNKTATRKTGGRPTNASRNAKIQSQTALIVDTAIAAASAAVKSALGIDIGNVTAIAATGTGQSADQSSTTQSKRSAKRPGRSVDPTSKMSLTREFFNSNKSKMDRAAMVKAAASKFGYSPQTANTYIANISREQGFTFPTSRGPRTATKRTGTNG